MKFKVFYKPIFHIIVEDVFTNEENQKILEEAVSLEDKFFDAFIGDNEIDKKIRSNLSIFYDEIYKGMRNESILLKKIDELFVDNNIKNILSSSTYPMTLYPTTNNHESQVSRYGEEQHYGWHIDSYNDQSRLITFIYWFNTEPKKYSGGELQLTNAVLLSGNTIINDDNQEIKTIIPKNNTMIIFGSHKAHRVLPTKSSEVFKDGRFSVNVWVGYK